MAGPIEPVVSPRHEQRRRSRAVTAAARVAVLVSGLLIFWRICMLALSLGPFSLRYVQVVGSRHLPQRAILNMAGVQTGSNIFGLPVRAIRRRLEAHPAIERAEIRRRLPGTLRIEVVERPIEAVMARGAGWLFVDSKSRLFECSDCSGEGLPELVGVPADGKPGRSLGGLLAALRALKEEGVSSEKMRLAPSGAVQATLAGGVLIKLGLPEDLAEKAASARQALAGLDLPKVEYLDVSCPTAIVWKSRDGSE